MRQFITAAALLACVAVPAAADVIHLKDGHAVQGRVKRLDAYEWIVYAADRRATYVKAEDVASIELTPAPATDPVAAARRLDAVRQSVAAATDPADAAGQYRRLIDAGADPATLAAARQDLAVWQDRADRHLARLGTRWVLPEARAQATADVMADVDEARQLLKGGRGAEAEPFAVAALVVDPDDVSARYLLGLVRLGQGRLPAARAAFDAVAAALPGHGPTRVNLALIDWQQRHYLDALAAYEAAMAAAPGNAAVLDDVAVALAAVPSLPPFVSRSAVLGRVTHEFQQQDAQLAARLTAAGLHRFGRTWLSDDGMARVRQAQRQDQGTLDGLAADFERDQDRIRQTDLTIADVQVQMRRSATPVQPGPWLASYDGGSEPPVYFELQNDADQLQKRRAVMVAHLDALSRQAAALRRRMAGEPEGGPVQRPVGPEGTPVRVPVAAAPATRPAR